MVLPKSKQKQLQLEAVKSTTLKPSDSKLLVLFPSGEKSKRITIASFSNVKSTAHLFAICQNVKYYIHSKFHFTMQQAGRCTTLMRALIFCGGMSDDNPSS